MSAPDAEWDQALADKLAREAIDKSVGAHGLSRERLVDALLALNKLAFWFNSGTHDLKFVAPWEHFLTDRPDGYFQIRVRLDEWQRVRSEIYAALGDSHIHYIDLKVPGGEVQMMKSQESRGGGQ